MIDVAVSGSMGLYQIAPTTRRGRAWVKRHLSKGERTILNGAIVCEGGNRCRDIVAAMVAKGLSVEVNGVDMKGYRND